MASTAWTPVTEALLTRLWTEEGRTFSEIAEALIAAGYSATRSAVSGRIRRMGLVGKQWARRSEATSATGPEKVGDSSTDGAVSGFAPSSEVEKTDTATPVPPPSAGEGEATGDLTIVAAKINTPAASAWSIAALREGQCRFACTAHKVPADQHRFCGARTHVGAGNLNGSWCPEHLERMFDRSSRMAGPRFLNRIGGGR